MRQGGWRPRARRGLQAIADANGDNRASGTSGYDDSIDYVVEQMDAAGYIVTRQDFDVLPFPVIGPSALQQTAPGTITYVEDTEFGPDAALGTWRRHRRGDDGRHPARHRQHLDEWM